MRFAIKPPGCDPLAAGRTRPAAGVGMPNLPHQWRGAKSIADDLGPMRGVVLSRATTSLRSIETQPFASKISLFKNGTKLYHKEENVQFIVLLKHRLASKVI